MSLRDNPLDKRHFHGALAKSSPYRIAPVKCVGPCGRIIESSCEIAPNSRVCYNIGMFAVLLRDGPPESAAEGEE